MDLLQTLTTQTRRVAVDALHNEDIEDSSPFSPEVPEDLREWLPDLFDRFPLPWPWEKVSPVDPALHDVWVLDNVAFRSAESGDRGV
jgi:hypothetical protein